MPFEYEWQSTLQVQGTPAADRAIDALRTLKVYTNQLRRCTSCLDNYDDHKMQYRMWFCQSSTCFDSTQECSYWLKVISCFRLDTHYFFEQGQHSSMLSSPRQRPLTRAMKAEVRPMIGSSMKPARIRNRLIDLFNLTAATVPELKTIQNFVYNYKNSALFHNDVVADVVGLARDARYTDDMDESVAFSFGYSLDEDGNPVLGEGTESDPFVLAFSTKLLLKNLDRDPDTFVFHMDATFKLTKRKFPLFVCGVSDKARSFHPVAFFIVSQRTEAQYSAALAAISEQYQRVVGRPVRIKTFMADAEDAQYNGFSKEISSVMEASYLMCFFHVVKNVKDKLKNLPEQAVYMAYRFIYEMHYAHSEEEYEQIKARALERWSEFDSLSNFVTYFKAQWLESRYKNWQCYHTPSGFAKTNNPAETFNKLIKRDYSLHTRLKVGELVQKVLLL